MAASRSSDAEADSGTPTLGLVNRLDDLAVLCDWLERLGQAFGLGPDAQDDLKLCVYEAVANIMKYAFEDEDRHTIRLSALATAHGVAVTIEDDGKPFDPLAVVPAPRPQSVAGATIGGHGIRLMKTHADALAYRRENGLNCLTIEKHR